MYVTWRKLGNNYYAYLVESFWDKEKKAPRTSAVYLGSSLPTAQKNLEKNLCANLSIPTRLKIDILAKLGEKAPPEVVNLPSRDRAKETVLRQLNKLRAKYEDRSDITFVLDRAIEKFS